MRHALVIVVTTALISPLLAGCDHQVSHTEKTSTNPLTGTQTTKEETTYQRPDGSTYTNTSSTSRNGNSTSSSSSTSSSTP
jgi:hypothetical protein